jgi:hypothetical protein
MIRFALLLLFSANLYAAVQHAEAAGVDIDTAARLYQAAEVREQVRASLDSMPAKIRQMFAVDAAAITPKQLDAVDSAAKRGFQIFVFEPPALDAFANNLDAATVRKSLEFLASDVGRRMVAADVALARLDEPTIDKIMSGELAVPSTPERDSLTAKLEHETQSTDSAVEIYLRIGRSLAVGTAIGSGMDPVAADQRAEKATDAAQRDDLGKNLREPLRRYLAYGYRELSDEDLQRLSAFLETHAGKRYVTAYNAAMSAGFDAMSKRCGEQIGESWRELAEAQLAPPLAAPEPPPSPLMSPTPAPTH